MTPAFTRTDNRLLKRFGIATDQPADSWRDGLEALGVELANRPVDAFPATRITESEVALRVELGKAHLAAEREQFLKSEAAARETQIFKWLDNACHDRDAQTGRARRWMVASWALFILLEVAITWAWSGR